MSDGLHGAGCTPGSPNLARSIGEEGLEELQNLARHACKLPKGENAIQGVGLFATARKVSQCDFLFILRSAFLHASTALELVQTRHWGLAGLFRGTARQCDVKPEH